MICSAKHNKQMATLSKGIHTSINIQLLYVIWSFHGTLMWLIMSSQILCCVSQYEIDFESFGDCIWLHH